MRSGVRRAQVEGRQFLRKVVERRHELAALLFLRFFDNLMGAGQGVIYCHCTLCHAERAKHLITPVPLGLLISDEAALIRCFLRQHDNLKN